MKLGRRNRRIIVCIFALLSMPIVFEDGINFQSQWFLLALVIICFFMLLVVTNAQAFRSTDKLDERQVLVRLKVTETAYFLFIGLFLGEIINYFITYFIDTKILKAGTTVEFSIYNAIVWILVAIALPTVVLAWLEPNPLPDTLTSEETL